MPPPTGTSDGVNARRGPQQRTRPIEDRVAALREYVLVSLTTRHDDQVGLVEVVFAARGAASPAPAPTPTPAPVLRGVGQLGNKDVDATADLAHRRVAPALLGKLLLTDVAGEVRGKDARGGGDLASPLMDRVLAFELNYKVMGVTLNKAVAGVDAAVWDCLGRALREPVWRLLARSVGADPDARDAAADAAVPVYASSLARSVAPEALGKAVADLARDHGVSAFKVKLGERMAGLRFPERADDAGAAAYADAANGELRAALAAVRAAAGHESGRGGAPARLLVGVDCNGGFAHWAHVERALRGCEREVWFVEEPVPWFRATMARPPGWSESRTGRQLPHAAGEQEFRADVWAALIRAAGVDWAQPDCGYAGGPTALLLVCRHALRHGISATPHSPTGDSFPVYAHHVIRALRCGADAAGAGARGASAAAAQVGEPRVELGCVDDGARQVALDPATGAFKPAFCDADAPGGFTVRGGAMRLSVEASARGGWGVGDASAEWTARAATRVTTVEDVRGRVFRL